MPIRVVFANLVVLLLAPFACAQDECGPVNCGFGRVCVAVFQQFPLGSPVELAVCFENTSRRPFRYAVTSVGQDANVALIQYVLYENSRLVPGRVHGDFILGKNSVRQLNPGEHKTQTIRLKEFYPRLFPGLYELRTHYSVHRGSYFELDYGMTPLQFERTIAFLQIGNPRDAPQRPSWQAADSRRIDSLETFPPARDEAAVAISRKCDGGEIRLPLVFQNCSESPIRYFGRGDTGDTKIEFLTLDLYRDYQLVEPRAAELSPNLANVERRELKPGEYLIQNLKLRDRYGDLPSGRYLLRAVYNVPKDSQPALEYDITPAKFEQTILFLEITGQLDGKDSR